MSKDRNSSLMSVMKLHQVQNLAWVALYPPSDVSGSDVVDAMQYKNIYLILERNIVRIH